MSEVFSIIALIIALTIHEFSHAYIADRLGDPTARAQGRVSLNPLRHLDPIGTLMLIFAHFGWGKPVPIDPYNLKNPKRDEILISLAGPGSNIILAILLSFPLHFITLPLFFVYLLQIIITFNIYLAIFNLIPIPPLDGSKVLLNLLPEDYYQSWAEALETYGPYILVALLFLPINGSNAISSIIGPIVSFILSFLL